MVVVSSVLSSSLLCIRRTMNVSCTARLAVLTMVSVCIMARKPTPLISHGARFYCNRLYLAVLFYQPGKNCVLFKISDRSKTVERLARTGGPPWLNQSHAKPGRVVLFLNITHLQNS